MPSAFLGYLRRTWWLWLTMVGIAIAGSWHLSRQPRTVNSLLPAPVKMEPHIELQFQDVTMQGREKGTVRWRIEARQVSASQNQQYIYFEREPRGSFYNLKDWNPKDGVPPRNRTVDWTAKKAEYDSLMDVMSITGSASFVTEDRDTVTTERVTYKSREHQILMELPMELRTHDRTVLRGHTATADTELEQLHLAGNVELVSPLDDQEKAL